MKTTTRTLESWFIHSIECTPFAFFLYNSLPFSLVHVWFGYLWTKRHHINPMHVFSHFFFVILFKWKSEKKLLTQAHSTLNQCMMSYLFRLAVVVIAVETKSLEHNKKMIGERGNEHTLHVFRARLQFEYELDKGNNRFIQPEKNVGYWLRDSLNVSIWRVSSLLKLINR